MRKKHFLIAVFILTGVSMLKAQDIHFSQIGQTPLLLNPASAGAYDGFYRGIINFKNQWVEMGKPYQTFMGSYDMPIFINKKRKSAAYLGAGALLFSDKAGDSHLTTTHFGTAISCIVPVGSSQKLSAGILGGVTYSAIDLSAIQWPNQYNGQSYDPGMPSLEAGKTGYYFSYDLAAGVLYHWQRPLNSFSGRQMAAFDFGAAIFHATTPKQRFFSITNERKYPRVVFHSDGRYDFEDTRVGIIPSVLFMFQGASYELEGGMLVRILTNSVTNYTGYTTESALSVGVHYRHKDAIIPQVYFEIHDFGIGLSYDINISSFSRASKSKGGFEISVKYAKMRGALYRNR